MRISIANRALSLTLVALALAPAACRDDKPQPPVENANGGTGGKATGGRGGTGGAKNGGAVGTGGAKVDAAGDAVVSADAIDVDAGDANVVSDGWVGTDLPTIETGDGGVITVMRPFFAHPPYPAGAIRPAGAQATLDMAVTTFSKKWKTDYVVNGCNGSFVTAPTTEGVGTGAVSQIHGAGMMAMVILAGYDTVAKTTFDNMFAFARRYKSNVSPVLMAHAVNRTGTTCSTPNTETETDGDLHIAMALLMADKQWGSAGAINYLEEAKKTITAIKTFEMNPTTKLPYVGSFAPNDTDAVKAKVRSSDLMPGHFQAFFAATGDAFWNEAVTASYDLIGKIQAGASATTGLLPDFITNTTTATPTPSGGAEGLFDYTSATVPTLLAYDFIANSRPGAKAALDKINGWIKTKTAGNPAMVQDGYQLNGTAKAGASESPLFETAFGAAAVVEAAPTNQAWLDAIWARAVMDRVTKDALTETSQMMALLVMSGHYWAP